MKLIYFAWVRERVGKAEEEVAPPASVTTVAELMRWLGTRGEEYAHAFEHSKSIRAAIDKSHVRPDTAIAGDAGDKLAAQIFKQDMLIITNVGLALLWLSALVTLYTGWDYMRAGVRHMID